MDAVQMVIQGGSVGVALYALHVLLKINGNHLKHTEEAHRLFVDAINKLTEAIDRSSQKIK